MIRVMTNYSGLILLIAIALKDKSNLTFKTIALWLPSAFTQLFNDVFQQDLVLVILAQHSADLFDSF